MWRRIAQLPCLTLVLCLSLFAAARLGAFAQAPAPDGPQGPGTPQADGSQVAGAQVRAVRLSDAEGSVQILRGGQTEFEQALTNMPLLEGSRLQTGSDGRAEIEFEDGAVARLTPNSSLALDQLSGAVGGATMNQLEVLSGLVYFEVGADRNQQYSIVFGSEVVTPNEASTFRVNLDANPPEMVVLQGSVQAANSTAYAVTVHEGETIHFDANDARYYLAQGAAPESWDQWNVDRDNALASLDAQRTDDGSGGSAGPDSSAAGWSDLDAYGDWYSVPDYGNVWAPSGVDASWDPYGSGYWGYYGGYGYMWISANPWGWLPYHCGAWNYFNGFGWGWIPGGCGSSWLFDGAIWNAPPYYHRPPRPHPVGPRDNLPHHNPVAPGRVIAVNRGIMPTWTPRGQGFKPGGTRPIIVGGRVVTPLPKTFRGAPPERIESDATRGIFHAPQPGTYPGLRPAYPRYGSGETTPSQGRAGYAPEPPSRASEPMPRPAPPSYSAPRYEPRPAPSAPRASAPAPAPRAAAPAPKK